MQLVDAPVCSEGTSVANAWILGVMAVFIGLLLCALMISMFLINRLRSENKRSTSAGVLDGIGGGHSSNTITPSGRGPWSDRELIAASPRSGSRASGSNPFVSSPHAPQDERVPSTGPYSKVAAGSFGSTIGGTVRFGEGDSGSGSHSSGSGERTDGDSKASLGKSMLTLKDGIGGSRRRLESLYSGALRSSPPYTANDTVFNRMVAGKRHALRMPFTLSLRRFVPYTAWPLRCVCHVCAVPPVLLMVPVESSEGVLACLRSSFLGVWLQVTLLQN